MVSRSTGRVAVTMAATMARRGIIARRVRDHGVYSEIMTPKKLNSLNNFQNIKGIIFSGGPSTVTVSKFESVRKEIFKKQIPIMSSSSSKISLEHFQYYYIIIVKFSI